MLQCVFPAILILVVAAPANGSPPADSNPQSKSQQANNDVHGDSLPSGAVARLGTIRWRHGGSIFDVAYSPDGKMIASAGEPTGICLWDAATGKRLHTFLPRHVIRQVVFVPDSKFLATWGNGPVLSVWDVRFGTERQFRAPVQQHAFAFSPDGKMPVSGGADGLVRCWETGTCQEIRNFRAHKNNVECLAFSPDGKILATGGSQDGSIRLWDTKTWKESRVLSGHSYTIHAIVFSPDGKRLASAGYGRTLRLWDVPTGKEIRKLGEKVWAHRVGFSPDSGLLAATDGELIRIWEAASGKPVRHWQASPFQTNCLAFARDGKTLASGGENSSSLRFWDLATARESRATPGHQGPVNQVVFSADGKYLFSQAEDHTVRRWLVDGSKENVIFRRPSGRGKTLLSPDASLLAVADDKIRLWSTIRHSHPPSPAAKEPRPTWALAFSADNKTLAWSGEDRTIRLWDIDKGKERGRFATNKPIHALAISPDDKVLAAMWDDQKGRKSSIRLWNIDTARELRTIPIDREGFQLVFSPDGHKIAASSGSICDVRTGQEMRPPALSMATHAMVYSSDGRFQAWASFDREKLAPWIQVVESATGQEVCRFQQSHSDNSALAFSTDGRRLASGHSDSTILIWDLTGDRAKDDRPARRLTPAQLEAHWSDEPARTQPRLIAPSGHSWVRPTKACLS